MTADPLRISNRLELRPRLPLNRIEPFWPTNRVSPPAKRISTRPFSVRTLESSFRGKREADGSKRCPSKKTVPSMYAITSWVVPCWANATTEPSVGNAKPSAEIQTAFIGPLALQFDHCADWLSRDGRHQWLAQVAVTSASRRSAGA